MENKDRFDELVNKKNEILNELSKEDYEVIVNKPKKTRKVNSIKKLIKLLVDNQKNWCKDNFPKDKILQQTINKLAEPIIYNLLATYDFDFIGIQPMTYKTKRMIKKAGNTYVNGVGMPFVLRYKCDPKPESQEFSESLNFVQTTIPTISLDFTKGVVEAKDNKILVKWCENFDQTKDIYYSFPFYIHKNIYECLWKDILQKLLEVCNKNPDICLSSLDYQKNENDEEIRIVEVYQKLLIQANRIACRNRRGAANWLIMTPKILKKFIKYVDNTLEVDLETLPIGLIKLPGLVSGRFKVWLYNEPENTKEFILLGYKGEECYDTGIVFCPNVLVKINENNQIQSNYGFYIPEDANKYYHLINVENVD